MARAGTREAEHDGAQLGIAQPLRHALAKDAALRLSEGARQMITLTDSHPCR